MTDFDKPLAERVRVGAPPAGFTDDDWIVIRTAARDPEDDGSCVLRNADLAQRMRTADPLPPFVRRGEWDALIEIVAAGREPSMTEILASIRRIQEEDDRGAAPDDGFLKNSDGSHLVIAGGPCATFESSVPMDAVLDSIRGRLNEQRATTIAPSVASLAEVRDPPRILDQDEIDSLLGFDSIPASPTTTPPARQGRFITLEGGEGAGKSTQLRRLAENLRARGIDVVTTREPGGSPGAEEIRALLVTGEAGRWSPITEALLHTAARRDHLERTAWPALDAGKWVLCDRFFDSTMAYQGYGLRLGRDLVETLQRAALGDFRPDLTLILDIDVKAGLRRAASRHGGEDRYERMDIGFHQRLRDGFLDIARREPERCSLIDAEADIVRVEARIWSVVQSKLMRGVSA